MPITSPIDVLKELSRPFTARDASAGGVSRWHLRQLVASGEVRRVLHEVFVHHEVEDTIDMRASAVALVAPPHAVACDRTAAWLWGVDTLRTHELDLLPPLEIFVLSGGSRLRRPEARGGERDLWAEDIVSRGGVLVTTPVRTSLDLACRLRRAEALAAMDRFAGLHGVDRGPLYALLPRFAGRRGVVQARGLVRLVDGRSESTGESFTRLAIDDVGLPAPEPQVWVEVAGVPTYRLDLAYRWLKICIEYDGQGFHASAEAKASDRKRRAWLREHGWIVIVVTKDDFRGPALDRWLNELRVALVARTS